MGFSGVPESPDMINSVMFSTRLLPVLLSPQLGKQLISYQVLRLDQGTFSFDVGSMEKMAPLT